MAAMTMPALLLQKPYHGSKAKEHSNCLRRRLDSWKAGNIKALLLEGKTIQQHLPPRNFAQGGTENLARTFAKLMFDGKIKAALHFLSNAEDAAGILPLDGRVSEGITVRDVLREKHPVSQPPFPDTLLPENQQAMIHPIYFEQLNGDLIRSASLKTQGGAGPSAIDANGWRRLYTSFQSASTDLCNALAAFGK